MQGLTESEVIQMLRDRQGAGRTQADFAQEIGISQAYLCDLYAGRRAPGPAILQFLGLEKAYVKEADKTVTQ